MNLLKFLTIGLILFSTSAQQFFQRNTDLFTSLSEIDNHHFGSMILSTVQVHMSLVQSDKFQQIFSILANVKKQLVEQKVLEDQKNVTQQAKCETDSENYRKAILQHTSIIETQNKVKVDNEDLLESTVKSLADTKENLNRNAKEFAEGQQLRQEQAEEFKKRVNEHQESLAACDSALALIGTLQKSTSFIQLKSHFLKVQVLLEQHKDMHPLFTPIIESLAQLSTNKPDQEQLKKIIDLLKKIKQSLKDSLGFEKNTESQRDADWKKRSGDLIDEKKSLTKKKGVQESNIKNYEAIIANASKSIEAHSSQLTQNQEDLKKLIAWCEKESQKYLQISKELDKEIEILEKVIVHLQKHFESMADYLKKRVNKF